MNCVVNQISPDVVSDREVLSDIDPAKAKTKAHFEPLKDSSQKHLTFNAVFLFTLGSDKRRRSDWSKGFLYLSPSFLSKNQLAKEGPEREATVVIPALASTLDETLKGNWSLCPVRAVHYYLDRTAGVGICLLQERV